MSNGRVALMIPSRDRPYGLQAAIRTAQATSRVTDIICYLDEDQREMYKDALDAMELCEFKVVWGDRCGPVGALNRLVAMHPEYAAYGMITDDSRITTHEWDRWLLNVIEEFPNRVCIVSAHHDMGDHVDWPFVSAEWIKAVGWYACPTMYHQCWPIITGLIGEMTGICHAPKHKFHVDHKYSQEKYLEHIGNDSRAFFEFVAGSMMKVVERVRAAMYPKYHKPDPVIVGE